MASSSGTSSGSGSSGLQNSGSEEDLRQLMDERKRKRMISNRESAKRSRMRKQKHLEDLTAQVSQLRKQNSQMITTVNVTTRQYLKVEAENSVLTAQLTELSHRLQYLNDVIAVLNGRSCGGFGTEEPCNFTTDSADAFINNNSWYYLYVNQPIMASAADLFQY